MSLQIEEGKVMKGWLGEGGWGKNLDEIDLTCGCSLTRERSDITFKKRRIWGRGWWGVRQ